MFLTELPSDKYGNRAYTASRAQVIEVEPEQGEYGITYRVISPASFSENWPEISGHSWPLIEVDGPVRFLTEEEYVEVLESVHAHPVYLERARARLR